MCIGQGKTRVSRIEGYIRYKDRGQEVSKEGKGMLEDYKQGKALEEIARNKGMSIAGITYWLEIQEPEYKYKYGDGALRKLRNKEWVRQIEARINKGRSINSIQGELGLKSYVIPRSIKKNMEDEGRLKG